MDLLNASDENFKIWADERIRCMKEMSPKEYIGSWGEHDKEIMTFFVGEFQKTLQPYDDKPDEFFRDLRKFKSRVNSYIENYRQNAM